MISEFDLLSEKIDQLANMACALRRENADLRLKNAELKQENRQLTERISGAYQRVATLIETLPAKEQEEEMAE